MQLSLVDGTYRHGCRETPTKCAVTSGENNPRRSWASRYLDETSYKQWWSSRHSLTLTHGSGQ